jgi:hypothetical protein
LKKSDSQFIIKSYVQRGKWGERWVFTVKEKKLGSRTTHGNKRKTLPYNKEIFFFGSVNFSLSSLPSASPTLLLPSFHACYVPKRIHMRPAPPPARAHKKKQGE